MSGSFNSQAENNPNVPASMGHVRERMGAALAANADSQAAAHRFISDYGAAVLGGHAPVNPADSAFISPMPIPAPEYPPGYDTFAEQNALVAPSSPAVDALLHPASAMAPPVIDAGID